LTQCRNCCSTSTRSFAGIVERHSSRSEFARSRHALWRFSRGGNEDAHQRYSAVIGKIEFLGDQALKLHVAKLREEHHGSVNYYIKREIITNNLFGVDLMEEATEIARLRLFLALVASAKGLDQLEPLPTSTQYSRGNSLIGILT